MIIKLAALGALGYGAYKYVQNAKGAQSDSRQGQLALAGGPLSDQARVQHTDGPPLDR